MQATPEALSITFSIVKSWNKKCVFGNLTIETQINVFLPLKSASIVLLNYKFTCIFVRTWTRVVTHSITHVKCKSFIYKPLFPQGRVMAFPHNVVMLTKPNKQFS